MKKNLYLIAGIALFICLGFSSKANIKADHQPAEAAWKKKVCFFDGHYTWNVTVTSTATPDIYTCTGTVDVDGVDWVVYGMGAFPNRNGNLELHASNPHGDNCEGAYVDSFTYFGSGSVTGSGSTLAYSGTGTWVSYCSGSVYLTGYWDASGPCANTLKPLLGSGPASSGKTKFKVALSPNPLKSSSTLTFNLAKESKVIITIYNSKLQPVKQIVNKTESAGRHSYVIDGSSLTNGVYRVVTIINGKPYSSALQVEK